MDRKDRFDRGLTLLNWLWYMVLTFGISAYFETSSVILIVIIIAFLFKAIEYFFSESKLSVFVKTVTILAIIYRLGEYGSFLNPKWLYETAILLGNESSNLYMGTLARIELMPVIFSILVFVIFKELIVAKNVSSKFTLLITFLGGGLLLYLATCTGADISLYGFMFVFIGIIKLVFHNIFSSKMIPPSNGFITAIIASLLVGLLIVWNVNLPAIFAEEFDWLKTQIEGGYSVVGPGLEGGLGTEQTTRQSGYSSNDTRLGGALEYNQTPVLKVTTQQPMYMRGETKIVYNGSGWEDGSMTYDTVLSNNIPFTAYPNVEYETVKFSVEVLSGRYPVVFTGLNTTEVSLGSEMHLVDGNFLVPEVRIAAGDTYEVTVQKPSYSHEVLRSGGNYPSDLPLSQYTSLPNDLPSSIRNLAQEITKDITNDYEKAEAIRNYLRSRQFTYSLDVSYPDEGMDFVEHFLLVKEGYCTHYSTAFVVMARSLGIPARWVKGFTPGDQSASGVYIITNKNAHAWAEIYVPNAGWVMFEPTPGFRAPQNIQTAGPIEPGDNEEDPDTNVEDPYDNPQGSPDGDKDHKDKDKAAIGFVGSIWSKVLIATIITLLGALFIGKLRKKEKKKLTAKDKVVILYNKVMGKLSLLGEPRKASETPREYTKRSSKNRWIPSKFLHNVTCLLERTFYGEITVEREEVDQLNNEQRKYNVVYLGLKKTLNIIKK